MTLLLAHLIVAGLRHLWIQRRGGNARRRRHEHRDEKQDPKGDVFHEQGISGAD
ncbi:MAG: hypothetical protein J0L58_16385 [Burkholderiales bacterium]|nr:hypothetical protein [Burkholderiales bacterium]